MNSEIIGEIYNQYYSIQNENNDYSLNSIGWNSSFTGMPYTADEMYEWRKNTIDLIKPLAKDRVLEAACGTGMMMFSILPDIKYYVGIDVAEEGIKYIRKHITPEEAKKTDFYVMSAENIDTIDQGDFDLAFINSATQYMGPADEFRNCIEKMIGKVKKGGRIFLGDIKSAVMQEKFYKLIALWEGNYNDYENRIAIRKKTDSEFYIDRTFFDSLTDIKRIKHIDLLVKKGRKATEMNMFRYDAVIYLDEYEQNDYSYIDCSEMDRDNINEVFSKTNDKYIKLGNIKNRLTNDIFSEKLGEEKCKTVYVSDACDIALENGYEVRAVITKDGSSEIFDIEAVKKYNLYYNPN